MLARMLAVFGELGRRLPRVLPIHPRTRAAVERSGLGTALAGPPALTVVVPLPYRENLSLMASARVVLTDSGGMQEATTVLGVPCLTMRENTARPITVERGTIRLVGNDPDRMRAPFDDVMRGEWLEAEPSPLWDGHAADRIAVEIERWMDPGKPQR